jgi:hypothetical protein
MSKSLSASLAALGHRCAYCGEPPDVLDHVISRAALAELTEDECRSAGVSGPDDPVNLKPACNSCNSSKRDTDLHSWLAKCFLAGMTFGVVPTTRVGNRVRRAVRSGVAAPWVIVAAREALLVLQQDLSSEMDGWAE